MGGAGKLRPHHPPRHLLLDQAEDEGPGTPSLLPPSPKPAMGEEPIRPSLLLPRLIGPRAAHGGAVPRSVPSASCPGPRREGQSRAGPRGRGGEALGLSWKPEHSACLSASSHLRDAPREQRGWHGSSASTGDSIPGLLGFGFQVMGCWPRPCKASQAKGLVTAWFQGWTAAGLTLRQFLSAQGWGAVPCVMG